VSPTNSTILIEWEDAPEVGRLASDWPYPTQYTKSLITGDLADRVRTRLGLTPEVPVLLTEERISGGYSEYTQETDYNHTITCGQHTIQLRSGYERNGLTSLLNWLDEVDEGL
jgi:hypothetical protein